MRLTAVLIRLTVAGLLLSGVARGALAADAQPGEGELLRAPQVLRFLDSTVAWYHSRAAQEQVATEPADVVALANSRATAVQVVQAGFDFARAASVLAAPDAAHAAQSPASARSAQLLTLLDQLQHKQQSVDGQLVQLRAQLSHSTGAARRAFESRIDAMSAQATLLQVRGDAVQQFLDFMDATVNETSAAGLTSRIQTLASSVDVEASRVRGNGGASSSVAPAAGTAPEGVATGASRPAAPSAAAGDGIWDLSARAWALFGKGQRVAQFMQQAGGLAQANRDMRDLLFSALRRDSSQSDALTTTMQSGPVDASQLRQEETQLQALTQQFRQITAALVPLSKISVLLTQYQNDLTDWRDSVRRDYLQTLRSLGVRLIVLAIILALVIAASELWRRAANRYVRDTRRRYQLLLMRRFVRWFVIAVVLASTFASRLDSFVTFAGLLTAGVAVAMQSVLLAVVGYFFLIGKYGIRVGDRVQIGEVLGEVVEVGLVRMQLMELTPATLTPTGRVVGFSNSIVFQAAGGLFKQIPGVHIGWHELSLTLTGVGESEALRQRLLSAVERALAAHREDMERQHRELERNSFAPSGMQLRPSVRLRYLSSSVEATVRYPVDQRSAAEIDEAVSRELLQVARRESQSVGQPPAHAELRLSAPGI